RVLFQLDRGIHQLLLRVRLARRMKRHLDALVVCRCWLTARDGEKSKTREKTNDEHTGCKHAAIDAAGSLVINLEKRKSLFVGRIMTARFRSPDRSRKSVHHQHFRRCFEQEEPPPGPSLAARRSSRS